MHSGKTLLASFFAYIEHSPAITIAIAIAPIFIITLQSLRLSSCSPSAPEFSVWLRSFLPRNKPSPAPLTKLNPLYQKTLNPLHFLYRSACASIGDFEKAKLILLEMQARQPNNSPSLNTPRTTSHFPSEALKYYRKPRSSSPPLQSCGVLATDDCYVRTLSPPAVTKCNTRHRCEPPHPTCRRTRRTRSRLTQRADSRNRCLWPIMQGDGSV